MSTVRLYAHQTSNSSMSDRQQTGKGSDSQDSPSGLAGEVPIQALSSPPVADGQVSRALTETPGPTASVIFHYRATPPAITFTYLSAGCLSLLELEPSMIQSHPDQLWQLIHPDDEVTRQRSLTQSLQNQEPWFWEGRLITSTGHLKWVRIAATPQTALDLWEGLITDITALKQAEVALQQQAERERLTRLVTQRIRQSLDLPTIFSVVATEMGRLLQVNQVSVVQYLAEQQVWRVVAYYQQSGTLPDALGMEIADADNELAVQLKQLQIVRLETAIICTDPVNRTLAERSPGAWLLVPVHFGGLVWGSITLERDAGPWLDAEVDLTCTIADQLAIAIQQSQLYQQVQQLNVALEQQVQERTHQLDQALVFEALLKRITDKVRDSLDESQILQSTVREVALVLGVDCCDTAIFDKEAQTLTIAYEYTTSMAPARGVPTSLTDFPEIYSQLLQGQLLQFCPTIDHLTRPLRRGTSILACPIIDEKEILGDLWLFNQRGDGFSELEIRLVQQVANQCAIAIRQARLYQSAQAQVNDLQTLNQLKDDFLSTVSHELRSPVANMKMAIQMLAVATNRQSVLYAEPGSPNPTQDRITQYLHILHSECEREISLINDLLDLQRLEDGRQPLNLEDLDLNSWLPALAESFEERANFRQQQFTLDLETNLPTLITDASCLKRIVAELLHNACKYTPPGQQITLAAATGDTWVELRVSNTGSEIPPEELTRIFEKFYRIPNGDPWKQGGTGLGLALVKRLVEHLGGTITAQSCTGQTCFSVTFKHLR